VARATRLLAARAGLALLALAALSGCGSGSSSDTGPIAFSATPPGARNASLYVVDPDGGPPRRLAGLPGDSDPSWSPDGRRVAFRRWAPAGCPRPHRDCAQIVVTDADWSPDGRKLAFARWQDDANPFANSADIYVVNADGTGLRLLTQGPGDEASPAWSPDGTRIAFTSTRGGNQDVYVMRPDGSDVRNVTRTGTPEYAPAWSPDGERIAFQDGDGALVVANADGTGLETLTRSFAGDGQPTWSPDGKRIGFLRHGAFGDALYVMTDDGSEPRRLEIGNVDRPSDPDWAPAVEAP
jgi:TolB protein